MNTEDIFQLVKSKGIKLSFCPSDMFGVITIRLEKGGHCVEDYVCASLTSDMNQLVESVIYSGIARLNKAEEVRGFDELVESLT